MSEQRKPTELIFMAAPSALPALVAIGIAAVVVGLYAWWPYSAAGALLALISLIAWLRINKHEIARMPIEQRPDTAPIPLSVAPPPE
ncbi:MAG: hypothetical protein ACRDK5_03130 [Solirubrobacterales bacterium]